jgi:hypothetical protein
MASQKIKCMTSSIQKGDKQTSLLWKIFAHHMKMHARTYRISECNNGHALKTIHPIRFFIKETTTNTFSSWNCQTSWLVFCNAFAPYNKLKPPNNQNKKCSMKFPQKMNSQLTINKYPQLVPPVYNPCIISPRPKMVTNSFGNRNFMQPANGKAQHAPKVPWFFSLKFWAGGGRERGRGEGFLPFFFCFKNVPFKFPSGSQCVPQEYSQ